MGSFIADQIELLPCQHAVAHPDADLLALVQRYKEARRVAEDANAAYDELGDRLADECPPEAAFGTSARAIRSRHPEAVLARMREFISLNITAAFGLPTETAIAAADAYEAKIGEAKKRLGFGEAFARCEEADAEQDRLLDEIRETPSQTLAGVVAKLRVMDAEEGCTANLDLGLIESDYWLQWKGSLILDAERSAGLPATRPAPPPEEEGAMGTRQTRMICHAAPAEGELIADRTRLTSAPSQETIAKMLGFLDRREPTDEAMDAAREEQERLLVDLIGCKGGPRLAIDKLRLALQGLKQHGLHGWDLLDYELVESALADLQSAY